MECFGVSLMSRYLPISICVITVADWYFVAFVIEQYSILWSASSFNLFFRIFHIVHQKLKFTFNLLSTIENQL